MRKLLIATAVALGLFAIAAPASAASERAPGVTSSQGVQVDLSARRYHRHYYRRYYYGRYYRPYYYRPYPYYYYRPYPYYYSPYGYYPYYRRPGIYFGFGW